MRILWPVTLIWGVAEATLFFIVPDVLIGWIALRHGLRMALAACLVAALGAAAGGAVVFGWSGARPMQVEKLVESLPAIPAGAVAGSVRDLRAGGMSAALVGAFQGMPYKVWSAAAPQAGWKPGAWALVALPIRLPRFVLIAGCFALVGRWVGPRVDKRRLLILHAGGWTAFYVLYWLLTPW